MSQDGRIKLSKNQFAALIAEVDSLCPLCQEPLIVLRDRHSIITIKRVFSGG